MQQGRHTDGETDALPDWVEQVPAALFVFDAGQLTGCNARALSMLGVSDASRPDAIQRLLDPDTQLDAILDQPQPAEQPPLALQARHRLGHSLQLGASIAAWPGNPGRRILLAQDYGAWVQIEYRLERQLGFERLLTESSTQLIGHMDDQLDAVIDQVLGRFGSFFAVDRAYVFLIDDAQGHQSNTHEWVAAGISREADNLQAISLDTFPWLLSELRADRVFRVERLSELPADAINEHREFEREGIQSLLIVPLHSAGQLLGFVGFDAVRRQVRWDDHYVIGLRLLAQMLASALDARTLRRQLQALALQDPLTGLPNRKLLEQRYADMREAGLRDLLIAVVDIDDFKQVNDANGHGVGDRLLCETGRRLKAVVGERGTVARTGGDEFVALVAGIGAQGLAAFAERLYACGALPLDIDSGTLRFSLSVGVASAIDAQDALASVLHHADLAMYRAKAAGKSRWVAA